MRTSTTRIKHLRFIIASNKRSFTDPVTWFVFLFLTVGFCTLHYLNLYYSLENPACNFLEYVMNSECVDIEGGVFPLTECFQIL